MPSRTFSRATSTRIDVLKLKDVIESIEASVNAIENISDIVESIALKHS